MKRTIFIGAILEQSTNCEVAYCDFGGGPTQTGYALTCEFIQNSVSNYIHNCTIHDCVLASPGGDSGHALTFGQAFGTYNGKPDHTGYNIIESNTVYHACHDAMSIYSPGNVVRQNFVHNEGFIFRLDIQTIGAARCMEVGGVYGGAGNVIEDNRLQYAGLTPTSGSHGIEIDGAGSSIYRHNTMSDCMYSGITVYGGKFSAAAGMFWGGNFIYNNTIALNGFGPPQLVLYTANSSGTWTPPVLSHTKIPSVWQPAATFANTTSNFFVNNLFTGNYQDGWVGVGVPVQVIALLIIAATRPMPCQVCCLLIRAMVGRGVRPSRIFI